MRRRRMLSSVLISGLLLVSGEALAQAPIKIGMLAPLTGSMAQPGKDMQNGCELFWEQHGWQAAGRKVEIIVDDTEGSPATALNKLRRLVESEKVHLVMGVILQNVAYALVPYIDAQGIPTIYPVNSADDLTQRKRPKWLVRTSFSASQLTHPLGEYAAKVLGYKKVVTVALDYAFGYESVGGFQRTFEENGGQIIQKIWVPLNVQDFAPYLAQLKREADATYVLATARWALLFGRQFAASGLRERMPLLGSATYTDEYILPQHGDDVIGVITTHNYSAVLENAANRKFVPVFEKRFNRPPSGSAENCYVGSQMLSEAIASIGGRVEDRTALMAALRKTEIKDAPRGPIKMDPYGNPIQNVYIRKVEKVGGKLQNTVLHTYPDVSQFWKYDPAEFLKQPVYTRDVPACKYC